MFQSLVVKPVAKPACLVLAVVQPTDEGATPKLDDRSKSIAREHGVLDALHAALKRPESTGEAGNVVEAAGAKRGLGLAEAANLARTLSQTPAQRRDAGSTWPTRPRSSRARRA
jgi:hypothetical protein